MKKLIALLIVAVFVIVGCGADTPSTGLVKQSLIKIRALSGSNVDMTVVDFERTNGQAINILGQAAYRVDGNLIGEALHAGMKLSNGDNTVVGKRYEMKTSVVFVKTEQGWEPKMLNGVMIPWELFAERAREKATEDKPKKVVKPVAPVPSVASIYRYVDSKGVVHFTNVKPAGPSTPHMQHDKTGKSYYRYVDKAGVVQYTNTKPSGKFTVVTAADIVAEDK